MEILQLTPGAGNMYCGNCLRDNALVAALRALGHQVLMVPLYLPLTLDETDQSAGTPIFFGGINVFLDQQSAWFRRAPAWLHRLLQAPSLLKWASRQAGNTSATGLGPLTLSMLQGEAGNQARELDDLIAWLKLQPRPDAIFLSNALLLGMARRLKAELDRPIVCMLQGEDYFLDGLPEPHRSDCWKALAERARAEVDLFIAPSHYFAELMQARLGFAPEKLKVVYNGINLDGYTVENQTGSELTTKSDPSPGKDQGAPVLGYLARMCREKGLDHLVEAFIRIRARARIAGLRLCVAGSLGPTDEPLVQSLQNRLETEGLHKCAQFHPNVDHATKLALLKRFSVFSVPAMYGEAFGLYVIEAMAAGVPVVQPRCAAFPEILDITGGGLLYELGSPDALANSIEALLLDPQRATALGASGRDAVFKKLNAEVMAKSMADAVSSIFPTPAT